MECTSNALTRQIQEEIRRRGPISFARFMELALYAPGLGYYERGRDIGRGGDFFTSVSVGPLFGQLLAFQFAQWMDADCPAGGIQFIEAGPHNGMLAADILAWTSRQRPDLFARLEYCLLDASPVRRAWQEETLRSWLPKVRWAPGMEVWGGRQVSGIIFSNEFLDALPVHRLAWSAATRQWQEGRVTVEGAAFAWAWGPPAAEWTGRLPQVPVELAAVLPDGFTVEICPAAAAWWRDAASSLRRGKLLTVDYGLTDGEWFQPGRAQGTLRAFTRHHASADLLSQPGEQDLTAHVNFSALMEAGRAAGLRTEGLAPQSKFLTEILARTRLAPESFEPWSEKSTRQFQTLAHPEHLGHKFQVLVQAR
jgi:SAM-dependent MidA family methyltransferase